MDLVKKNVISIICGVVIVAVIVFKFVWLDGQFQDLQTKGQARIAVADGLNRALNDSSRRWPRVSPNEPTARPLRQFPSTNVIAIGSDLRRQGEDQSTQMYELAVNNNQMSHPPLNLNVFPQARTSAAPVEFQQQLKIAEDALRNDVLKGTLPPTHAEMEDRAKKIWDADYAPQIVIRDGKWVNDQPLKERYTIEMTALPAKMRAERAAQYKIYLDNDALPISAAAANTAQPMNPDELWYSQMSLWIQTDVAKTIADMNRSSDNIADAPIKRLLSIQIVCGPEMYVSKNLLTAPSSPNAGFDARAGSTTANPSDDIQPVFSLSPTGRACNSIYDVAQFKIVADVEVDQLENFIDALSTDRLLTVRNIESTTVVDYRKLADDGFLYGDKPVVQVVLDCEELFMRQWTVNYMPPTIKRLLRISDDWKPWQPNQNVAAATPMPIRR